MTYINEEKINNCKPEIDDGGPAFPQVGRMFPTSGMSLRDWFAGQALTGLLASGHFTTPHDALEDEGAWLTTHPDPDDENFPVKRCFDFPEAAWRCADAMLRERNRKEDAK